MKRFDLFPAIALALLAVVFLIDDRQPDHTAIGLICLIASLFETNFVRLINFLKSMENE